MNKKRFYLISILILAIAVFSTAVTCNFCGTPVEVITPGEDTADESVEEDSGSQSTGSASSESSNSSQATSENTEDAEPDNNPPEIVEIEMDGTNIEIYEEHNIFDNVTITDGGFPIPVSIIAMDSDDDDILEYRGYDSRENEYEVTKYNNNSAEFTWYVPSETGPYTLTIEVSDGNGGLATRDIEMMMVVDVFEFIPPEDDPEDDDYDFEGEEAAMGEGLRSFGAIPGLTGQVSADGEVFLASESSGAPTIFAGDTADNVLVKGFISFDISEIAGDEILQAWLTLEGNWIGNSGSFSSSFSVGHLDYGNSLDPGDFNLEDDGLGGGPPGFRIFSFSNEYLKDAVQSTVDAEKQYFQLMLSHSMASNNDTSDGYTFLLSDIELEVSYR